jgi:hypothetical protein
MSRGWSAAVVVLIASAAVAAPVPKGAGYTPGKENGNALVKKYRHKMTLEASTEWQGYPVANLFDEKPETAWYSNNGDAPMNNSSPWVKAAFPEDVLIHRVTVLGNRDPQYPTGYGVLAGKIELLDKAGKVLRTKELKASGDKFDFDWVVDGPPAGVRAVRFTATDDEKRFGCVGLGEVQLE